LPNTNIWYYNKKSKKIKTES